MNAQSVDKIVEHLALQEAAGNAQRGLDHGSVLLRLPVGSWQADVLRKAPGMPQARTPMGLRAVMQDPAAPVIFVPADAIVTRDVIDRVCAGNPLRKTIVWETDSLSDAS